MSKTCYHCGDAIVGKTIEYQDHLFCCNGCKSVYQLLTANGLGNYYSYEANAGTKPSDISDQYNFLDLPEFQKRFIEFEDETIQKTSFFLPSIHCSSCIYLLENITKIEPSIISCEVNFTKKTARIVFDKKTFSLSKLANLLTQIGYAPNFEQKKEVQKMIDKRFFYQIGVAGFAFGSIMLWTFPEYLGIAETNPEFRAFTSWLSLAVSIPVLLFSAQDYIKSAWTAIKNGAINLDVPIALGILALYAQSAFSIILNNEPGYMDSFSSFVFFLLIGKWFQNKTYSSLAFDRDYTAYFPLAVTKINLEVNETVAIENLKIKDRILIKNEEIIPCDCKLASPKATIDYSFITGESHFVTKNHGDYLYAGGKIIGKPTELIVERESLRSQLTSLWNESSSKNEHKKTDRFSVFFLVSVLIIAAIGGSYWFIKDSDRFVEIIVAVLIVACPCALALSEPFTYGNIMRKMGRHGMFLKNNKVIADLAQIDTIVFDKTGTLTTTKGQVYYSGLDLSPLQISLIYSGASASNHPFSRTIAKHLYDNYEVELYTLDSFNEVTGKGIDFSIDDEHISFGSAAYLNLPKDNENATKSWVKINDKVLGNFSLKSEIRPQTDHLFSELKPYSLHLLSGDNTSDEKLIGKLFPQEGVLKFNQTPEQKKTYIEQLRSQGKHVLMIGDGLNDIGALKAANVGTAISDDVFHFTPSSDSILDANALNDLPRLLKLAKHSKRILRLCFVFSILYNGIGLTFALFGLLSPLVAAILMPLSSISIVLITFIGTQLFSISKNN